MTFNLKGGCYNPHNTPSGSVNSCTYYSGDIVGGKACKKKRNERGDHMKKRGKFQKERRVYPPPPLTSLAVCLVGKTTDVFHLVLWPPVNDLFPLITKVKRPHLSDCIDNKNNYMHKVG